MIGISLHPDILTEHPKEEAHKAILNEFCGITAFLAELKKHGVDSIEVRTLPAFCDKTKITESILPIVTAGMNFSIHTTLAENSAAKFCDHFEKTVVLLPKEQNYICFTVHTIGQNTSVEENITLTELHLKNWAEYSLEHHFPFHFALENSRKKNMTPIAGECDSVCNIVRKIALPNVGICFDFGHFYSNQLNNPENTQLLPSDVFAKNVIHTHIHGIGENRTHFPITSENIPLERYCVLLQKNAYHGIYNIELEFERFYGKYELLDGLFSSINLLQKEI